MTNTELIRQEIERRIHEDYAGSEYQDEIAQGVCASLLWFIDSLQEKTEIDLDEEITKYWKDISSIYGAVGKEITRFDFDDVCRYFYELGKNGK